MSDLLLNAEAPWHRLERGQPVAGQLPLLGALRPELGWPRWVLKVPMRWRGGADYERLDGALLHQPFLPPTHGMPGEPWRFDLPLDQFPALESDDAGCIGLLILAVYLEPRALALEGAHRGRMRALEGEELLAQLKAALEQLLALPASHWWQGFVPRPEAALAPAASVAAPDGTSALAPAPLVFALAACQYPPGLLDASPGHERDPAQAAPALAAMARLHTLARHHPLGESVSLLLLAGDQIYADASGGLADSQSGIERYARAYQQFKAGPVRHLPPGVARIVHSVDDHEIADNWEPQPGPGPWFEPARQAAWDYRWEAGARVGGPQCLWHDFDWRGAAFFVADARCEREPRRAGNWRTARLWSQAQQEAFAAWLTRSAGRPRFMLSGSLPLPRRRTTAEHPASCLRSDAWDGYPHSLHGLLGELWRQRAQGLVFLSGDEHRSGWVTVELSPVPEPGVAPDPADVVRLHSVHSSALYAPWPFAVTWVEELATPDTFDFPGPDGRPLRCTVTPWHDHPGDGFAVLRVAGQDLHLWFDRADRPLHLARDEPEPQARLDLG